MNFKIKKTFENMQFLHRLKYYLIGFGLGCVLVWATLYQGRERPSWMPEGRVLEFLEAADIDVSEKAKSEQEAYHLSASFMDDVFWKNAKVNFENSAVKRDCPIYSIESILKSGDTINVYIESCETCEECEEEGTALLKSIIF